jgi:uncharacterized membrane-anchored protein
MNWDRARFWFWLCLLVVSPIVLVAGMYVFLTSMDTLALIVSLLSIVSGLFSYKYFTEPL